MPLIEAWCRGKSRITGTRISLGFTLLQEQIRLIEDLDSVSSALLRDSTSDETDDRRFFSLSLLLLVTEAADWPERPLTQSLMSRLGDGSSSIC